MAFSGLPLRFQPPARNSDDLRSQDCYWFVAAKNYRVSRLNVFWPMSLDHTQYVSAQEHAAVGGNGIPTERVEIVHAISENKAKACRAVPVPMPFLQVTDGRPQPAQWMLRFCTGGHVGSSKAVV